MRERRDERWLAEVGARLEQARDALRLKHIDMARTADVTAAAWSNYVGGKRPISIDAAILLCDKYKLTLDWIYRGVPDGLPFHLGQALVSKSGTVIPLSRRG